MVELADALDSKSRVATPRVGSSPTFGTNCVAPTGASFFSEQGGVAVYRQYNERAGISLEQGTPAVPQDNRYHLLRAGVIVASLPSLKRAMAAYKKLVEEALQGDETPPDRAPAKDKRIDPVKESTERYLDAKDAYWTNSHKYRRGGRLGRR